MAASLGSALGVLETLKVLVVLDWVTVAVLESNDGANARPGASPRRSDSCALI